MFTYYQNSGKKLHSKKMEKNGLLITEHFYAYEVST
jgi:hypothetical protein